MRSVPQRGFWLAIVAINSRISGLNRGRPRVDPSNHQPEESIPVLEVRPLARAERDLELVAQEQVLDREVVALTEEGGQGGEEDAE